MDHLFRRVGSHTRTLENFSDHMAHEVKNRLFEIQSTLEVGKIADPYHAIEASLPLIHHLARMSESLLLLHTTGDLQKSDIYPKDLFVNF